MAAVVANAILSLAVDQLFHTLGVYPPWGVPMYDALPNALALTYRVIFGIGAGWLVARLAPAAPMRHVRILGIIGTLLATIGAIVALTGFELGAKWYPIALALLTYPAVWFGGVLATRSSDT